MCNPAVAGGAPLLVIDTSGPACAVALDGGAHHGLTRVESMTRGHGERLLPLVAALLDAAGVPPAALDGVVVCTGPGGFTGVRVGVAAALGIAKGAGIPCCGVTRFAALAHGRPGASRIVLPAGGGLIFAQAFRDGAALAEPAPVPGDTALTDDGASLLPALAAVARARGLPDGAAPLYLRAPDAAPSAVAAPVRLG